MDVGEKGVIIMKLDGDGKIIPNQYDCRHCKESGVVHEIIDVPHDTTGKYSCWGEGIPTTRRECTGCKRWDGPWVSADLVCGD